MFYLIGKDGRFAGTKWDWGVRETIQEDTIKFHTVKEANEFINEIREPDLYIVPVNDDGTYGESIKPATLVEPLAWQAIRRFDVPSCIGYISAFDENGNTVYMGKWDLSDTDIDTMVQREMGGDYNGKCQIEMEGSDGDVYETFAWEGSIREFKELCIRLWVEMANS